MRGEKRQAILYIFDYHRPAIINMEDISRNIAYKKKNYWRYPMKSRKLLFKMIQAIPGTLTSRLRILPDFIIIGVQKCGTSSVYFNLKKHPCISPALTKEIHFFDNNFHKGIGWYRKHFPTRHYIDIARHLSGRKVVTGEASPDYILYPHIPRRIYETVPGVKLLVFLANPADRAYSQYHHYLRKGLENLSFEEALEKEEVRLKGELEKIQSSPGYYSFNYEHYSYISRGMYIDQIKRWTAVFPRRQFFIESSEDFYKHPEKVYSKILDFLELPGWLPKSFGKYNAGKKYEKMKDGTRKMLIDHFKPYNEKLYEFLGRDLGWDR